MHHIVSDAWSVGIFIRELSAVYNSFVDDEQSPLPALNVQYADFSRWQQHWFQGDVLAKQLSYWKQHLAGAPALLNFPTDRPRPAVQKFQGESRTLVLSRALAESLKILSRRQGATLFMTLLAAFKTLLFRYTGQTDIVVGTPVAGRNRADIEGLIGFFVNTQAIRTQLSADTSFGELLAHVRTAVLEGQARQDLPFEKLVEELQPERSLSHTPIFQVMFALQNVPMPALELSGLTVNSVVATVKTAKFDFSLSFEERADGLVGTLEYNTDLFDDTTMTRLLGHYERLLQDVVNSAETKLGDLELLTAAERAQLLVEWNDTAAERPSLLCVHQQFEQHAESDPNAIAVLCDEQSLTYGELNARANALAHQLRKLGIGTENIVAICTDRTIEMFVGTLGILKAGAAYLPLDPHYPRERLDFMLQDSGASVLLTQELIQELVSKEPDQNTDVPRANIDLDNLAYVIYTSGSTGRPKGVAVSHGALLNLVSWHNSAFNITASDRATLLAGVSFDASVWELWPYLSCGASLDIPPDDLRSSPEGLRDWITERAVTVSFVPTPVAEPMLALEWSNTSKLRMLLTGGDRLHTSPARKLPFAVVNNYGPTENAVVSTSGLIDRDGGAPGTAPTIGRPISNVGIYIVDDRGEPVPVGEILGALDAPRAHRNELGFVGEQREIGGEPRRDPSGAQHAPADAVFVGTSHA